MSQFIVTLKLDRNRAHDPANKVTGLCPLSGHACTDQTGQHHSVLMDAQTATDAHVFFTSQGIHVTRVEAVTPVPVIPGSTVTDVSVTAAATALRAHLGDLVTDDMARDALVAALKVACKHYRMGYWWVCNFGADEVRTCPDCDMVEQRKRKVIEP